MVKLTDDDWAKLTDQTLRNWSTTPLILTGNTYDPSDFALGKNTVQPRPFNPTKKDQSK